MANYFAEWAPQWADMTMVRGETLSFNMVFEESGVELEEAAFSCKVDYEDSACVFQKTLGDGISLVEANTYAVRVAPEDTAELEPGRYVYDLMVGANDDRFVIARGDLVILNSVIKEA